MRVVEGLRAAFIVSAQPLPKAQSPAQKLGLAYERKLGKALQAAFGPANVAHGPWFRFEDSLGEAFCSPDFILRVGPSGGIVIVEAKLSYVPEAIEKLLKLYCPVIGHIFRQEVFPLVITKHLRPDAPRAESTLKRALALDPPVLQWLGQNKLPL
jgi:hypothetical protein